MVCGVGVGEQSAHGKRRPQTPSVQILSLVLIFLLARSAWAWITGFGTSQVQAGLHLDRQLEAGSTGCQARWGGGGTSAKNVLFLPPLTAGFQKTVGSS